MNYLLIFKTIGNVLRIEAVLMALPSFCAIIYGESVSPFLLSMIILLVVGSAMALLRPKNRNFKFSDSCVVAALSWLAVSLFGALPFYYGHTFTSFIDCFFEAVAGFTTTGATVLRDVEVLPKSIMLWRSLSHWIGGMGVVVFMLAILPSANASAVNLLRAESSGIAPDRIVPKIRETAKVMYIIYITLTAVLFVALLLCGLPAYDSLVHALSTAATGGISNMNEGIYAYNNVAAEMVLALFMFLFGINFSLYFHLFRRKFDSVFEDEELKLYSLIVLVSIIVLTWDLKKVYGSGINALRYSVFEVASLVSSSGFATHDVNLWPTLSRFVVICLMIMGGCAGSTAGGIKPGRFLIMFKSLKNELHRLTNPRIVKSVLINGRKVESSTIVKVAMYFFAYFSIAVIASALIAIDGTDMETTFSAVIASLSNIGPGLSAISSSGSYEAFGTLSKMVLAFCMLAGRLEIFPVLLLFQPSIWKRAAKS